MIITVANKNDLQEILQLQYLAYQSEAKLCGNMNIPPLTQTLEEVLQEYEKGIVLKVMDNGDIIGSVRGYIEDDTLYIGKLIVKPDKQNQGIGTKLLTEIENVLPHQRCELFTSSKSDRNIKLYQKIGYNIFKEKKISNTLKLLYLEK
ncbi:GNAT family N-acetyltransferase [Entomomonas moraniae]|uniref:GNAT family N-acetyltransferase n=1 Tax=Entomomonas moraniae TaxID=2213226 RepID=A0A3S9XBI6_9GAMM|nr:GNAT family N-acetyltransferase [Entomomonas moraniae]AZS49812.1 GNAT family N-acetyltransferase [Entomomonas moraniae]